MLGNTDFVNTHHPGRTSPLVCAAQQGNSAALLSMVKSGGKPEKQGSDWAEVFKAATSTFRQDMAVAIHAMMGVQSLLPVSQPPGTAPNCCFNPMTHTSMQS